MEKLYYEKYFNENELEFSYIIKTVIKYFVYAIVILILIAMLFGVRAYFVGGWSMQPTIDYMSLVLVNENVDKYNLKEGDIVTFKSGIVNTHRIVEVNLDSEGKVVSYQTKGDNPNLTNPDPILYPSNIIGRVITVSDKPICFPNIGYTILDVQNHKELIVLYLILIYVFFCLVPNPRKYVCYYP